MNTISDLDLRGMLDDIKTNASTLACRMYLFTLIPELLARRAVMKQLVEALESSLDPMEFASSEESPPGYYDPIIDKANAALKAAKELEEK